MFFECLTSKHDLRTKRKSNSSTISSENEIEKWLWDNQQTVHKNRWSTINSEFSFLDGSGGVETIAVSNLHRSIEKKISQKFVINLSIFLHR